MTRCGWLQLLFAASCSAACGSNRPELPANLSAPIGCVALGYPDAPYCAEPGSVVQNICLQGLRNPDPRSDSASSRALSDSRRPTSQKY